eukprot:ANDGO_01428.mRNA.1 hypothetical protein
MNFLQEFTNIPKEFLRDSTSNLGEESAKIMSSAILSCSTLLKSGMKESGDSVAREIRMFQAWRSEFRILVAAVFSLAFVFAFWSGLVSAFAQSTFVLNASGALAISLYTLDADLFRAHALFPFTSAFVMFLICFWHSIHISWFLVPFSCVWASVCGIEYHKHYASKASRRNAKEA